MRMSHTYTCPSDPDESSCNRRHANIFIHTQSTFHVPTNMNPTKCAHEEDIIGPRTFYVCMAPKPILKNSIPNCLGKQKQPCMYMLGNHHVLIRPRAVSTHLNVIACRHKIMLHEDNSTTSFTSIRIPRGCIPSPSHQRSMRVIV